jgi:hypothetical protein
MWGWIFGIAGWVATLVLLWCLLAGKPAVDAQQLARLEALQTQRPQVVVVTPTPFRRIP